MQLDEAFPRIQTFHGSLESVLQLIVIINKFVHTGKVNINNNIVDALQKVSFKKKLTDKTLYSRIFCDVIYYIFETLF